MIAFYFARKDGERKWSIIGEEILDTVRKWSQYSSWNYSNKIFFLEGECYFLKGEDKKALTSYHASIKAAKAHKFAQEEGLANEKMATYHLQKGRHDLAMKHFKEAKQCYDRWGAGSLVMRMDKAIARVAPLCKK